MTPEMVVTIGRHALEVTLMLSAPLLLTALAVGLIVGIFQAATSPAARRWRRWAPPPTAVRSRCATSSSSTPIRAIAPRSWP